jgi:hypothetical protein
MLGVLIDTGSNNNFIREALVDKLGLSWVDAKCIWAMENIYYVTKRVLM